MCNQIERANLAMCQKTDVIAVRVYDEHEGKMVNVTMVVMSHEPIVVATKKEDGTLRTYGFAPTKLGNISLPQHIAVGGTLHLTSDQLLGEIWTVQGGISIQHNPNLAKEILDSGERQVWLTI